MQKSEILNLASFKTWNWGKNKTWNFKSYLQKLTISPYNLYFFYKFSSVGEYPLHCNFPGEIFHGGGFPLPSPGGFKLQPVKYFQRVGLGSALAWLERMLFNHSANHTPWSFIIIEVFYFGNGNLELNREHKTTKWKLKLKMTNIIIHL